MKQKNRHTFLVLWWTSSVVLVFTLMLLNARIMRQPPFNDLFFIACFSLCLPSMLIFVLPMFLRPRQ